MTDKNNNWFVYILECSDGSFYTGATNDLDKRIEKHNKGTASKYTRSRLPVRLLYQEYCGTKSSSLKREHTIKKMSRTEKEYFIRASFIISCQSGTSDW